MFLAITTQRRQLQQVVLVWTVPLDPVPPIIRLGNEVYEVHLTKYLVQNHGPSIETVREVLGQSQTVIRHRSTPTPRIWEKENLIDVSNEVRYY